MIALPDTYEEKQKLAFGLEQKARQERPSPKKQRQAGEADDSPPMSLLPWVCTYRTYLQPDVPFTLRDHLYAKEMYEAEGQEIVFMKAGQVTVSELMVSYALHACDQRKANVLVLMPTTEDVSDFSSTRFGLALEASPYLNSIVVPAGGSQRGADKVTLKRIRNKFLYLRGSTVSKEGKARQLKSAAIDVLIADEVDEMNPAALPIARKRLGHSHIKEVRLVSTPTYHGAGIHAAWRGSDQREWFVKCRRCNKWQQLLISNIVIEWDQLGRPTVWHGKNEERAWIACVKCGAEMNRLAYGCWVPRYPGRSVIGFHPTKLMAAQTPLINIVHNLFTVNETKLREAWNQDLGLPYTPRGGRMTQAILDACKRDYGHGPVSGIRPFAGIDVGKLLHIVIRAPMASNGERRQLWAGDVYTFKEAANILKTYNVQSCVVDALPETRKARELQSWFPDNTIWLAYYSGAEDSPEPVVWNRKKGIVNVDRTRILDEMYAGFYDGVSHTLPAHIEAVEDYYKHLCAMVRVREKKSDGTEVVVYIEEGADHFGHAEGYCLTASKRPFSPPPPSSSTVSRTSVLGD